MTIWMTFIFPFMWFIILLFNYLLVSFVFYITMRKLKLKEKKYIYKNSIIKLCISNIIFKFFAAGILFIPIIINNVFKLDVGTKEGLFYFIIDKLLEVTVNPFDNLFSFILTTFAIVISGILIYKFNYNYSLRNVFKNNYINEIERKKIALSIAIFSAPYLFYLPAIYY